MNAVKITELRQNLQHWVAPARQGERIGVSVHGEVVAELVPAQDRRAQARRALAKLRKTVVLGDIVSPIGTEWPDDSAHIDGDSLDLGKLRERKR